MLWAAEVLEQQMESEDIRFSDLETGHELHLGRGEEALRNVYRKAVYLTRDASPYRPVLDDLGQVQQRAMRLTGAVRPYDGLLEPILLDNVEFVRLRSQVVNLDRVLTLEGALDRLERRFDRVKQNARRFEAVSLQDDATGRLRGEIEGLERARAVLEGLAEAKVLERTRRVRVTPTVYRRGRAPQEVYLRDVGLVLEGPDIGVEVPALYRRRRRDRVTRALIEPLLSFDNVTIYSHQEWQEKVRRR